MPGKRRLNDERGRGRLEGEHGQHQVAGARDAAQASGDEPAPMTQAEFFARQAGDAWQAGQAALVAGNLDQALIWLERACRIAPDDASASLSLAAVQLRRGAPAEAAALLERLIERHASREALLLLAAARQKTGQSASAAAALASALAGHALTGGAGFTDLADQIVASSDAAGWCGLTSEGAVVVHVAPGATARLVLDGKPYAAARTPLVPQWAAALEVTLAGQHCLGSPLDLRRIRRVEGVVAARDGGLSGWAWHPGDPDRDPVLRIQPARGRGGFTLTAADQNIVAARAMARPRRFDVPASRLAGLAPPVRVIGSDGVDLAGSPLDPYGEIRAAMAVARAVAERFALGPRRAAAPGAGSADALCHAAAAAWLRGPPATAAATPDRPVAVVMPVFRGLTVTRACLDSVVATVPDGTAIVLVDDASPEPDLVQALDAWHRAGRIRLVRHAANRGFPASANTGMRAAAKLPGNPDIVLLNSDTVVTPGWIEGLRAAVHAAADIGTATPFSNDASILSYPAAHAASPARAPTGAALQQLARHAARANAGVAIDIPTAVGFCMYVRRECLRDVGVFRDDVFAQGYGEENDFCLRAGHLGWRHVAVPGVYVAHLGGQSFGSATAPLLERNLAVLERLHPGYRDGIAAFQADDPLAMARRRLDVLRWQGARTRRGRTGATLLVTHDSGGGVERVVRERCAAIVGVGQRAIVLRPLRDRSDPAYNRGAYNGGARAGAGWCRIADGADEDYPNLLFAVPSELDALVRLLRADRPVAMEVHHLLGHDHAILRLARMLDIPVDVHVHDYAWFCPRVTLVGAERRYCGEPADTRVCDACIADAGSAIEEEISPAALRARSARDLASARRVVTPSADTAARMRRQFAGLAPSIVAHEVDGPILPPFAAPQGARRRVCVIGGIGPEKGYDLLLGCARDAAARDLPLEFVLVGHTPDDQRLLETGRVFVTGAYREGEGEALIRAQQAQIAWLPSLWPETWCFTLGVAWRAGLRVAVFDIGAQAERVRATGQGWVLPLGLPAGAINNTLGAVQP